MPDLVDVFPADSLFISEPLWRYGVVSHEDLLVAPTEEPILIGDVLDHLRALNTEETPYITRLIGVVRRALEFATRRAFMPQTWQLVMDQFPRTRGGRGGWGAGVFGGSATIRVPRPPLISVTSITYIDLDDTPQTLDPATYQVDIPKGPHAGYGRIRPVRGQHWPDTARRTLDAVRITFRAGYSDATSPPTSPPQVDMPADLVHAMLVMLAELYKVRSESVPTGQAPALIRARALWAPYKVF